MTSSRFVLSAIDPAIGCPSFEAAFRAEPARLAALLDIDPKDDATFEGQYPLGEADVQRLRDAFAIDFDAADFPVGLRR
jgi:hypothetical protein